MTTDGDLPNPTCDDMYIELVLLIYLFYYLFFK